MHQTITPIGQRLTFARRFLLELAGIAVLFWLLFILTCAQR